MVKMLVTLCLLFAVGTPSLCASANYSQIDKDTLLNVFGSPLQVLGLPAALPKGQYYLNNSDYDHFDWVLAKRITAMSNESFLLSPLGLKLALAILHEAATGQTQAELASVLNFDNDPNVVRKRFSAILESLQTPSSHFVLKLGSRIYLEDSIEPQQRFAAIAQQFYKTEMKRVDFNNATVAANEINGWINNLTEGRIPALVSDDDVGNIVVMVLSAIYFRGTWVHPFPPNATKPDVFYVSPTELKQVSFMSVRDKFYYAESVQYDAKILRMPYLGNKFSMYVLVPNSITGVDRLMSALDTKNLKAETLYLQEFIVDVKLPKFTFDYAAVLDNVLYDLGIRQAFEDTASFPGISRGQSLKQKIQISKVLQRSGIEVNEVGSVAYSATEISLVNKFGEDTDGNQEVLVNRPFVFYIQDDDTRQVLFSGRIMDPTVKGGVLKYA